MAEKQIPVHKKRARARALGGLRDPVKTAKDAEAVTRSSIVLAASQSRVALATSMPRSAGNITMPRRRRSYRSFHSLVQRGQADSCFLGARQEQQTLRRRNLVAQT